MISYKAIREIAPDKLERLFKSVGWRSAEFPVKLSAAMKGSDYVISAWDGDRLVGLGNALSDGLINVYFPYIVVDSSYQGGRIGEHILLMLLDRYRGFFRRTLICYNDKAGFYKKYGFLPCDGCTAVETVNDSFCDFL